MHSYRLAAIRIPLSDGVRLLIAPGNEPAPEDGLAPQTWLPQDWEAKPGTDSSPIIYEPAADQDGMHPLWLVEVASFYWELQSDGSRPIEELSLRSSLVGSAARHQWHQRRSAHRLHGDFRFTTYLGAAWFQACHLFQPIGHRLRFEVITEKIKYAQEYRAMVEAIGAKCSQLLLDWGAPTTVNLSPDPQRNAQTLLEKFLFLRHVLGPDRLDLYLETLSRNPHSSLLREQFWQPAALASPSLFARDPLRYGRDWAQTSAFAGMVAGFDAHEILSERKFQSLDTPPNRFVKFALQTFRGICEDVLNASIHNPDTGQTTFLNQERGAAWQEALQMRDTLDAFLASALFGEVGPLHRIPFESQALQKREGYRDILHAWLMLDVAAQLDWPGHADAYDGTNRDVATLYEFWLYFVLAELFQKRLGMVWFRDEASPPTGPLPFCCKREDGGLRINLKRGSESFCRFRWSHEGQNLLVHFFYNRQFDYADNVLKKGSYSKVFRPDYTLVILPDEAPHAKWNRAEELAEQAGKIAYLHFDAKYRIDQLKQVFGAADETDLDRQESKSTGTVKHADLYKMHTYNEAIRRTVGSYVLYPGTDAKASYEEDGPVRNLYRRYHELIPGIGAFAVKPKGGNGAPDAYGLDCLQQFLHDFLTHQASRFTQNYRINFWTHDTIREPPAPAPEPQHQVASGLANNTPPKDTQVLLGFVRDEAAAETCRTASVFFCHAIEWDAGTPRHSDGSGEPGTPTDLTFDPFPSKLFVAYYRHTTAPWLAEIKEVKLVTATERAEELHQSLTAMQAAYYYRFQLANIQPAPARDVSALVHHRPGRPIARLLSEFAPCSTIQNTPETPS